MIKEIQLSFKITIGFLIYSPPDLIQNFLNFQKLLNDVTSREEFKSIVKTAVLIMKMMLNII